MIKGNITDHSNFSLKPIPKYKINRNLQRKPACRILTDCQ